MEFLQQMDYINLEMKQLDHISYLNREKDARQFSQPSCFCYTYRCI